jgi:hypothetical protein
MRVFRICGRKITGAGVRDSSLVIVHRVVKPWQQSRYRNEAGGYEEVFPRSVTVEPIVRCNPVVGAVAAQHPRSPRCHEERPTCSSWRAGGFERSRDGDSLSRTRALSSVQQMPQHTCLESFTSQVLPTGYSRATIARLQARRFLGFSVGRKKRFRWSGPPKARQVARP